MEDKKNAKQIKIMTMLKGQVKSEIVDVQKEFDKTGGYIQLKEHLRLTEIKNWVQYRLKIDFILV